MTRENCQLDSEIDVYADREWGREEWRVTYFDGNSGCYITIFAGPFAEKRARDYADALKARRLAPIPAP